jgi:hypothetical protein
MLGAGFIGGGDIYFGLLGYCLLLSISLKLGAAFARSRGWQTWDVPRIRFLWPFTTLAILLSVIVLVLGMAWLRPPIFLGQSLAFLLLVFVVAAVFSVVIKMSGQQCNGLRGVAAAAVLSSISIVLSGAFFVVYFMAKYTFLLVLLALTFYSTRTR